MDAPQILSERVTRENLEDSSLVFSVERPNDLPPRFRAHKSETLSAHVSGDEPSQTLLPQFLLQRILRKQNVRSPIRDNPTKKSTQRAVRGREQKYVHSYDALNQEEETGIRPKLIAREGRSWPSITIDSVPIPQSISFKATKYRRHGPLRKDCPGQALIVAGKRCQ